MRRLLVLLGFLWTLPNTILGLLLGVLSLQLPRLEGPLIVFDRGARGYSWLIPRFGYSAQTFGFVVISVKPLQGYLYEHERHHVRQYSVLGPMYLPIYGVLFLFHGYRRHPFELEASQVARIRMAAAGTTAPQTAAATREGGRG
jgi:hypothetical protein